MTTLSSTSSDLLDLLRSREQLLVLTHANPDPDSLASAMGLMHLAETRLGMPTTFAYAGRIMRAENREMVRCCQIRMTPQDQVDTERFDCLALVDTQPGFGHTHLPRGRSIDVVIDHHIPPGPGADDPVEILQPAAAAQSGPQPFHDVRTDVGATSSMVGGYLLDTGVEIPTTLATALFYGIKTDTADLSRNVHPLDERVYEHLMPLVDRAALRTITQPSLPADYFRALREALNNVRIYGDAILCSIGRISTPEMVAEVADLLLRHEGKQVVFCGGLSGDTYYVSLRTEFDMDSYRLLEAALDGEGSFGGHGAVAGGCIPLPDEDERTLRRFERKLERNILAALGREGMSVGGLGGVRK